MNIAQYYIGQFSMSVMFVVFLYSFYFVCAFESLVFFVRFLTIWQVIEATFKIDRNKYRRVCMCVYVFVAIGIEFISSFYHLFCTFKNVRHFHVRGRRYGFFFSLFTTLIFASSHLQPSFYHSFLFFGISWLHFHFYFWLTYFNGMWHVHAPLRYWKLFTNDKIKIILIKKFMQFRSLLSFFLRDGLLENELNTRKNKNCTWNWAIAWATTKIEKF